MQIALAQFRPVKADYAANVRRVGSVFAQAGAWEEPPGLVVFGETAMTGYFLEGGVQEHAVSAGTLFRDLNAAHAASGAPPLDVCVGFYERHEARVFNSSLYATLGGPDAAVRHVHRKVFLPTYGLFDEERFVDAGRTVQAFDTAWGRVAMLVCEDAWHSTAAAVAALDGARLMLVPSASPGRGVRPGSGVPNSVAAWDRLVQRIAEEHGVYVALVQIAGFEGGKGFQGCSTLVGPDGTVVARGPAAGEALVRAHLRDEALHRARAEQPLLADLELAWPHLIAGAGGREQGPGWDEASGETPDIGALVPSALDEKHPEPSADPLAIDAALLEDWLVRFLRAELSQRGFAKGMVGVSGGVDSAVTLALAVRALGADNVIALNMPYSGSSADSRNHAALAAKACGVPLTTVDISGAVDGYFAAADPQADAHRRGNAMARVRMITLFDLGARDHAMPLGTGNKSERLMGYFTWHGDDSPPINPIGDLFKTQVLALARHLGVPEAIINKAPTADLVQGQTDEGDLGVTYAAADVILHYLLSGFSPVEIAECGADPAAIDVVRKRMAGTHWKRKPPTVALVSRSAIGESWLRPVDY